MESDVAGGNDVLTTGTGTGEGGVAIGGGSLSTEDTGRGVVNANGILVAGAEESCMARYGGKLAADSEEADEDGHGDEHGAEAMGGGTEDCGGPGGTVADGGSGFGHARLTADASLPCSYCCGRRLAPRKCTHFRSRRCASAPSR